ncbi:MAG: glycosyltransferase family 39 protein [Candidatus Woesearchaeota archaeon]
MDRNKMHKKEWYKDDWNLIFLVVYILVNIVGISALFTDFNFKNDEVGKYLPIAKSISYDSEIKGLSKTSVFYPAIVSTTQLINKMFGLTDPVSIITMIRITHLLIVNLAFVFLYLLGKELFSQEVGLFSAAFLTLMSYWVTENRHFLLDTPGAMFVIAATYFLFKGLNTEKWHFFALSGAFLMFAFMAKFQLAIFGVSFFAIFLIEKWPIKLKWFMIFGASCLAMLGVYLVLDFVATGKFAATLITTFNRDFNVAFNSTGGLYFVPIDFYPKSILTFVFPLSVFILYGLYKLSGQKKLFFQIISLIIPLPIALSFFIWKESRYVIAAIPFLILIGFYGMREMFKNIEHEKRRVVVVFITLFVLLAIMAPWLKKEHFTRLDYDTDVVEYPDIVIYAIALVFISVSVFIVLVSFFKKSVPQRAAFIVTAIFTIMLSMPLHTFAFPNENACSRLVMDNIKSFSGRTLLMTPCAVPNFLIVNSTHETPVYSPNFWPRVSSEIKKADFLVAKKEFVVYFSDNFLVAGKKPECISENEIYCIYRLNPSDKNVVRVIVPTSEEIFLTEAKDHSNGVYFLYREGSSVSYMPNIKNGTYVIRFNLTAAGPPPYQVVFSVESINKTISKNIKFEQADALQIYEVELGYLTSPLSVNWVFVNDTAKYNPYTQEYYDDRNVYLSDIKLLEVRK